MPDIQTSRKARVNHGEARVYKKNIPHAMPQYGLWARDVTRFLKTLPRRRMFDLVITSPPYNIGKEYEERIGFQRYLEWQAEMIEAIVPRVHPHGSICWQIGNYVENGSIKPLDVYLHPLFTKLGLQLRNRIVWHFGHGLHCTRRFSGRYEVILWYSKTGRYIFNLDEIRVDSKYPGKRFYKGPNAGKVSSNPRGKNPEDVWRLANDVWEIPNVNGGHKEKTVHPCQFPVGLAERLILALTRPGALVFDPLCGVGSAGVAAAARRRHFWGCDIKREYLDVAKIRIDEALAGKARYRPHDRPIYDHRRSSLAVRPEE